MIRTKRGGGEVRLWNDVQGDGGRSVRGSPGSDRGFELAHGEGSIRGCRFFWSGEFYRFRKKDIGEIGFEFLVRTWDILAG
jgi:hypothetical protein